MKFVNNKVYVSLLMINTAADLNRCADGYRIIRSALMIVSTVGVLKVIILMTASTVDVLKVLVLMIVSTMDVLKVLVQQLLLSNAG